jgi:hypothetical protein
MRAEAEEITRWVGEREREREREGLSDFEEGVYSKEKKRKIPRMMTWHGVCCLKRSFFTATIYFQWEDFCG